MSVYRYKKLAMELSVGWSKSTVGDISSPDAVERVYTNSPAARESKPADIKGAFAPTNVPSTSNESERTFVMAS